jgi:hypothetical protein
VTAAACDTRLVMSFVRLSLLVAALSFTACVKQSRVQEPRNTEWFQLCNDTRFNSICKPASPNETERPIQIDTNLAFPSASVHRG